MVLAVRPKIPAHLPDSMTSSFVARGCFARLLELGGLGLPSGAPGLQLRALVFSFDSGIMSGVSRSKGKNLLLRNAKWGARVRLLRVDALITNPSANGFGGNAPMYGELLSRQHHGFLLQRLSGSDLNLSSENNHEKTPELRGNMDNFELKKAYFQLLFTIKN